ncbi:SpoIIE family protein phosphatase [Streptomyces sp. NPDC001858]
MEAWKEVDDNLRDPSGVVRAAMAVLDADGVVIGWSPTAEKLLGYPAAEAVGRAADELLAVRSGALPLLEFSRRRRGSIARSDQVQVRHRAGHLLKVAMTLCPLADAAGSAAWIMTATGAEELGRWEAHQSMLKGLATQSPVNLCIFDTSGNVAWANASVEHSLGMPLAQIAGKTFEEILLEGQVISEQHPSDLQALLSQVLSHGEPMLDVHYRGRSRRDPVHDYIWSCAYFRLQDAVGRVLGVCGYAVDITSRYRAQQRLELLVRAGGRIGMTLDANRIARDLADVVVPGFADAVTVDVLESVLTGDDLEPRSARLHSAFRRVERRSVGDHWLASDAAVGEAVEDPSMGAEARSPATGETARDELSDDTSEVTVTAQDRAETGVHSRLAVPLRARDLTLGVVTFLRAGIPDPFDTEEIALARELAARTALCLDNAHRYAREHATALTLQRSLLPRHVPDQLTAVEVAHRYLPASTGLGVGGDWFDVIPLSGTRVGLVVGDVVGHGLRAAATMGRLRTTVRALAQLDQAPDELLTRLDALIGDPSYDEEPDGEANVEEAVGVTCLYLVYDPVAQHCAMASAGHLPPAIVRADGGGVTFPELPLGPPLGLGGLPFATVEFDLPECSLIALFTDGLVESRNRDVDIGLEQLAMVLAEPRQPLEDLCERAVATLLPEPISDDAALLLVRTRALDEQHVAAWTFEADPTLVAEARTCVTDQLTAWQLEDLTFTSELVVSELVTNVIRYAAGPVSVRLIRDRNLICEVSDTGHTSPHLRRAANDDEGGRGLFLIAQLTLRWGTRYTPTGKTIWTEQLLHPALP